MSYLMIVILSALVGVVGGKYLKGSEQGSGMDALAGAVGGCVAVALSRVMSPAAAGYVVSVIVSIGGAMLALYALRYAMKAKRVPAPAVRRRR